ncbi:uncharacterized protein TNCV_241321 [Trichonephila clavipes]|nr:uncharacterized protein TNCV_241321 [Trichonephila clavipes]
MAPDRPRKSTPTELTTDEEDMVMYDVQAEKLEPNAEDKFAVMECFVNNPSEYMRALTPTRLRNSAGQGGNRSSELPSHCSDGVAVAQWLRYPTMAGMS